MNHYCASSLATTYDDWPPSTCIDGWCYLDIWFMSVSSCRLPVDEHGTSLSTSQCSHRDSAHKPISKPKLLDWSSPDVPTTEWRGFIITMPASAPVDRSSANFVAHVAWCTRSEYFPLTHVFPEFLRHHSKLINHWSGQQLCSPWVIIIPTTWESIRVASVTPDCATVTVLAAL